MGKSKIKSFFSNLWYYHKWHILVGALALLALIVTITQCVQNTPADVSILYVGSVDIGKDHRSALRAEFEGYFEDVNGDGKNGLMLTFMGEGAKDTKERLQVEYLSGDHNIYFLNKEIFEWLLPLEMFAPLNDVLGELPENAYNEYGIELKYLDLAEADGFKAMDRDTVVCLRSNTDGGFNYEGGTKLYKNNASFFVKLINYKKEGFKRENVQLAMIGERALDEPLIRQMEDSLYYISKLNDPDKAPILEYENVKLNEKNGELDFDDEKKMQAEDLVNGNKLLLLDVDAYTYLSEIGMLLDIKTLGADLPDGNEQYGIMLSKLPLFDTDGFYYADRRQNSRMYLCASKDAEGYTVALLRYLYGFKTPDM